MDPLIIPVTAALTTDTTDLKRRLIVLANGFEDAAEALRRTVRNLDALDDRDRDLNERFDAATVQQAEDDLARSRESRRRAEQEARGR